MAEATETRPPLAQEQEQAVKEAERIIKELPIEKHRKEIQDSILNNEYTIIVGGTGSGKTVKTPQMIREIMDIDAGDKLIVTEPRQVNTSSLAARIAEEQGVKLGEEVGFKHGADESLSEKTNMLFETERLLINQILGDPTLSTISHVMIDEVHVRSADTEELLDALKGVQEERKKAGLKPLKIIAASATVNKEELSKYFNDTKPINVEGKTFPVQVAYSPQEIDSRVMPAAAASVVSAIANSDAPGDVIVFVAGTRDIDETARSIEEKELKGIKVIKLHSQASESEKKEVEKAPPEGIRRVIIATNYAETGVTINGLKFVVNTGEEYESTVDPESGLTYLRKIKQAKAGADQRSGRVGRTSPGTVFNLFTESDYRLRPDYPTPEIKRSDLTDLVLTMKKRGVSDIERVPLLSAPLDKARIEFAVETLKRLKALNPDGTLNKIGERMVELPTSFHLARLIAEAEDQGKGVNEVCTIAAMVDGKSIIRNADRQRVFATFGNENSDFLTLLNIWREFEKSGKKREWAYQNGLNYDSLMKVDEARSKLIRRSKNRDSQEATDKDIEKMIFTAYRDRLMEYDDTRKAYVWNRDKASNLNLKIDRRRSAVARYAPSHIIAGDNGNIYPNKNDVDITLIQRVDPEWLNE